MSEFPKTARHPSILAQVENWQTLRHKVNVTDESRLSDIPGLDAHARRVEKSVQLEYVGLVGEIICAQAIRALAKGYESLEALATCDQERVSISAAIHAYNASFFSAKSFCMLMGFGPFDRTSKITVDAFSEGRSQGRAPRFSDQMEFHKYEIWGHGEVWRLTRRLIHTVKVPDQLEDDRAWLRRAKLKDSSKFRNAFNYDDTKLSPIEDSDYVDFPDKANGSILDVEAPEDLAHQFLVAKRLMRMCNFVLDEAKLKPFLWKCASRRRIRQAHKYAIP